jgi:hypothetical protein
MTTDAGPLEAGVVYVLTYARSTPSRGAEAGTLTGYWTGAVDYAGQLAIARPDGSDALYLFPEEVVDLQRLA